MPSWSKITSADLDTELALEQPDPPDYTTSRPITVDEIQGSLDVSWPSTKTKRVIRVRLQCNHTQGQRQLPSGVWLPLREMEPFWWITQTSQAVAEPRLMEAHQTLLGLAERDSMDVLMFRTTNGIFALGYCEDQPFYAQYS